MRSLYKNQIVDYNDGKTEFVEEFNEEIKDNGAICYNHLTNTYQYIRRFEEIEFINELDPWYFRVIPSSLPNGINIEMNYAFNPEDYADDEEIQSLWQASIDDGVPYYDYDEDGEIYEKEIHPLSLEPTKHIIWKIDEDGKDLIYNQDQLLLYPMIKYISLAKEIIKSHTKIPFDD